MDSSLGVVIRVLTRNNYQSTHGDVVDATTTETRVLNRFRELHPDQAAKEFGTRFQRSYYYYLVKVSTSDEIVNMVAQVRAEGGDISPFVVPEDAILLEQQDRIIQERDEALNRQRAEAYDVQRQSARQDELALQRQAEAQALQRQAEAQALQRQAAERARQDELARQRAEALDLQRQAAERARQDELSRRQAEALALQRQAEERARQDELARQRAEALALQRQAEERARQEELARQAQAIPANIMALLIKARDALIAPGMASKPAFEGFISELFSFETANNAVFKSTYIDPLIFILIENDRYWSDNTRIVVVDIFNLLVDGKTQDYLVMLLNLATILKVQSDQHKQQVASQPPDPIVSVPNTQIGNNPIPCRENVTLTNFVYHSLSCPYESMMTALFKVCTTTLSRAVRFATKFNAPQSVTPQQCQTLHQSVMAVLAYLHSDAASTRTVDDFGLRDAFVPFLKDPARGMHDVSDLIEILAQFYGLEVYADGAMAIDDPNVHVAPDILLSMAPTGIAAEDYGRVDYAPTLARTHRTFKGKTYQLMACLSHKSIAHWVSYVRDSKGDWFAYDGNAKRQEKVVLGKLNTTMRGVKNVEEPFVWVYINSFDLNRVAQKAEILARVTPIIATLRRPADVFNANTNDDEWIRILQGQLRKVYEITGFSFEADVQRIMQEDTVWINRFASNIAVLNVIPFAPGVKPEEQRFLIALSATVYVFKVLHDMDLSNQLVHTRWLDVFHRSIMMGNMLYATWGGVKSFARKVGSKPDLTTALDTVVGEINSLFPGVAPLVLNAAAIQNMQLKAPLISLPMARDILAAVEVHPTYSSKRRGLHYDAIQSDLLPVISDAYNRNADAIEASPRLKEALMPMTSNQGQLNVGRGRVADDIRTMHWISVAADLLMAVDDKQPVDEFLLVRCLAERPVAFMKD